MLQSGRVMLSILSNARGRARPKLTWAEIIKKYLLCCGLTTIMLLDRAKW